MLNKIKHFLGSLWDRPDPLLAEAGMGGEMLVAKVRLGLATLLMFIPILDYFFFPVLPEEAVVGFSLVAGTFVLSVIVYLVIARGYRPPWLSFAGSSLDVTIVSVALAIFLFLNEPHTAVNSKVIFECYFLAIGGTGLRFDKRICITAGLLAVGEYLAIVLYASIHWDLNSLRYAPYEYGEFSWSAQSSRLIIMLAASILSLAMVSRGQKLLHLATSDPLTGLFNRGYIDDRLSVELSRAQRYGKPLTLAVIDADRFKLLNDTHGHPAGDLALRTIADLLRESFRQSDTSGRYGGEEFIVILPETDIEAAHRKLESLRSAVDETELQLYPGGPEIRMTISAGLASYPRDGQNAAELFFVADERMFQAKRMGRNRVVAGSEMVLS